jgi:hypothetical protein
MSAFNCIIAENFDRRIYQRKKISDIKSLKRERFSLADIDKKLFQAFSEQIFHTGFVHADPHPGNGKKVHNCV